MKQTRSQKTTVLSSAWGLWIALAIAQTILSIFLYNPSGLRGLRYAGWLIGALIYVGASHLLPEVERENRRYSVISLAVGVLVAVVVVLSKR